MKQFTSHYEAGNDIQLPYGQQVSGVTAEEILDKADLNWNPVKKAWVNPFTGEPEKNLFGMFRNDTHESLGQVKARYEVLPHIDRLRTIDLLIASDEGALYTNAGHFDNGAFGFVQASLAKPFNVAGVDPINKYVTAVWSHNGTINMILYSGALRIVCQNTFMRAASEGNKRGSSYKHTKAALGRIEENDKLLEQSNLAFKSMAEKFNILANKELRAEQWKSFTHMLFGNPDNKEVGKGKTGCENKIAELTAIFESNDNDVFPQFKGTLWNAFNALTNFADYNSDIKRQKGKTTDQARTAASLLPNGTILQIKEKGFQWLLKAAETAKTHKATSPKHYSLPQLAEISKVLKEKRDLELGVTVVATEPKRRGRKPNSPVVAASQLDDFDDNQVALA